MNPATYRLRAAAALLCGVWLVSTIPASATPIGYAFSYQGYVADGSVPANGPYDFRFLLFDAASGGTQYGGTLVQDDLSVTGGVFSTELDFGQSSLALSGAHWLQVEVRPGISTGAYTVLPRQKLNPTPYAVGLSLPHWQIATVAGPLITLLNQDTGAGSFAGDFTSQGMYGLVGRTGSSLYQAAGVRGEATATSGTTIGVVGVATASPTGTGIVGTGAATGAYISATGATSTGLYAYGYSRGIYAENLGVSNAIYAKGKGKTASDAVLRLENTEVDRGMCAYLINHSNYATAHLLNTGTGETLYLEQQGTGNYITATSPTGTKFWVDNTGTTHTKVLEILGGADVSERFDVAPRDGDIEPGSVVCIDPDHEGRLVLSRERYDRRVAGIVSGAGGVAPGMLMGQSGSIATGAHPVALSGRVYCRATTEAGPIRPGDLLTTSSAPGRAMRVADAARAQGAILGKAMGTLESGDGLVLVLVGLQ